MLLLHSIHVLRSIQDMSHAQQKDYKQKHFYEHGKEQRLLPRVPWLFRWLDKAAIVKAEEESRDPEVSLETQEKKGQLCMVKEVREVKSLVPMIYVCFAFFACSLLQATGNTFFVSQASIMTPDITTHGNDISILFLIKDVMSRFMCFLIIFAFRHLRKLEVVDFKCKRKAGTIIRIGFGMACAVICSLIAWQVEARRLKLYKDGDYEQSGRNSTLALVPQFSLLGMAEGLVEGGFASLFYGHVAKPMWSFEDAFSELMIGSGKLVIIPLVLIFSSWFKETVNTSHLDRFYLMLGILNAVFLFVFVYYSIKYAYKEECPEDEEADPEEDESNGEISAIEEWMDAKVDFNSENSNEIQWDDQGRSLGLSGRMKKGWWIRSLQRENEEARRKSCWLVPLNGDRSS